MNRFVMNRTGMSISLPSARSSCTMAYQSISFCHLESAPGVLSKFLSFTGHSRSVSKCKSHTTRPEMREATLAAALSPKAMLLSCTRWGPSSSSHQICRWDGIAAAIRLTCLYQVAQSHLSHSRSSPPDCLRYQTCSWKRRNLNHSKPGKASKSIEPLGEHTCSASGMPGTGQL